MAANNDTEQRDSPLLRSTTPVLRLAAMVAAPIAALFLFSFYQLGGDADARNILLGTLAGCSYFIACIAVLFMGVLVIATRHPYFDAEYSTWLEQTPWEAGMPLPRGPVRLQFHHVLIASAVALAPVAATLWFPEAISMAAAPLLLLPSGAAAALHYANANTGRPRYLYASLGVIAAIGSLTPTWFCIAAIPWATYLLGLAGARSALKSFPWSYKPEEESALGWPYATLLRCPKDIRVSTRTAALWGVLTFVVIASLCGHVTLSPRDAKEAPVTATMLCGLGSFMLMLARGDSYKSVICPQLCWGERAGAGRWIVPRHDILFFVLLAIPLSGAGVTAILAIAAAAPVHLAAVAGMALAVFVTFGVGPTVAELHYTGRHAITSHPMRNVHAKHRNFIEVHA